jgi:hypothetical protein
VSEVAILYELVTTSSSLPFKKHAHVEICAHQIVELNSNIKLKHKQNMLIVFSTKDIL